MKKFLFTLLTLTIIFLTADSLLFAVPAYPGPIKVKQPDGKKITLFNKGDEFYGWLEDENGYTVIQDTVTKQFCYAQKNSFGKLQKSSLIVGKDSPSQIGQKHLKDETAVNNANARAAKFNYDILKSLKMKQQVSGISSSPQSVQAESRTNFVVLVQFSDLKFKSSNPIGDFEKLLNGSGNSVKNYFKEVSYGKLDMTSKVYDKIITVNFADLEKNKSDYYAYSNGENTSANRVREMIEQVLKQIVQAEGEGYFDEIWKGKSEPEGFEIIHAGGGAEVGNHRFIWSHKWTFNPKVKYGNITFTNYHIEPAGRGFDGDDGITPIGVICHETTHFFDIIDLYNTKRNSGKNNYGYGLGNFCLMAGGSWNDNGDTPAPPSAWVKYKLGWATPKKPQKGRNAIEASATEGDFYKINGLNFSNSDNEYFLIENKQNIGFDKALPGDTKGLLIYHIDETQDDNDDDTHYMVDVEEADATTSDYKQDHLAKAENPGRDEDYFRQNQLDTFRDSCTKSPNSQSYKEETAKFVISNISSSGKTMYFDFTILDFKDFINKLDTDAKKFIKEITGITVSESCTVSEQETIDKYFNFSSSETAADDINKAAPLFYEYMEHETIYSISPDKTGKIPASKANTVNYLNKILKFKADDTSRAVSLLPKNIGNISDNNNSPLNESLGTAAGYKRFTGTKAVENIKYYIENLGYLIYSFDKMQENQSYDIQEIFEGMDLSLACYQNYILLPGEKSITFKNLSNVTVFPNPVRNGEVTFINLPTDTNAKLIIEIYTITGHLVKQFNSSDMELLYTGNRKLKWNCINSSGKKISYGVYIALIRTDNDKRKIKFAVIK